jgi:uncharacterized membrane protein
MAKLDELSRAIGRIEEGVKNLNEKFDGLPCANQETKLEDHEKRLSSVEGKMTIISAISGFIGSILFAVVSWILTKVKLF